MRIRCIAVYFHEDWRLGVLSLKKRFLHKYWLIKDWRCSEYCIKIEDFLPKYTDLLTLKTKVWRLACHLWRFNSYHWRNWRQHHVQGASDIMQSLLRKKNSQMLNKTNSLILLHLEWELSSTDTKGDSCASKCHLFADFLFAHPLISGFVSLPMSSCFWKQE